ncbi:MAG: thioredoxin domain-containing protein [Bacteroidota bacterium]|jgi:thioredoxin
MRKLFSIALVAILFNSCSNGQTQSTKTNLSANEFAAKMKELPTATIIDVRTSDEFSKGHLANANNYDWNGNEFDKQIAPLDKSEPVFVYCLSGGRSSSAASKMRSDGFKEVYELSGGIMKWRGANLPETTDKAVGSNGMSKQQFDALLSSDKLVLIDFYADWCAPCKKMKPYLDEISRDMADKVVVIRINADDNQALCKEFKIDALPVLQLYKNKTLSWTNAGFIEKAEVVKQLQ